MPADPADQLPLPAPWSDELRATLPPRPAEAAARTAVGVAELASGCLSAALIDACSQDVLARSGDLTLTQAGVDGTLRRWGDLSNTADEAESADALAWHTATLQYLATPVPKQPGLYLLGVFDRPACDLQQARWQFTVALHELA